LFHATTIIAVKKGERVAIAGDGQVTISGNIAIKHQARKVRKLYNNTVIGGFAGSVADALTLTEKFEGKLEQYGGSLKRAAVELAKDWRTDKVLRRLEAMLIALDRESLLVISGNGEVIEPDDNVIAVGSGGPYALAAARALYENTGLDAAGIAEKALRIASGICVYTNDDITVLEL